MPIVQCSLCTFFFFSAKICARKNLIIASIHLHIFKREKRKKNCKIFSNAKWMLQYHQNGNRYIFQLSLNLFFVFFFSISFLHTEHWIVLGADTEYTFFCRCWCCCCYSKRKPNSNNFARIYTDLKWNEINFGATEKKKIHWMWQWRYTH